ncbi:AAA domain-containing protein, partial [Obelidium mucronatum]
NQTECELICLQLYKFLEHTTAPIEIGVVCPFTAQKELLQKMVESLPRHNARITVNTIDGFQGQERDIIILSLTKSGTSGQFINDPCRMNVALTRAKSALWVFGDKNAFLDNPGMW